MQSNGERWVLDGFWELFVDGAVIEKLQGAQLRLHHPVPQEVVLECDRVWEGNTSGYFTVLQDGNRFRMYYRGSNYDVSQHKSTHAEVTCVAESTDGVHWERPNLGLYEFNGSRQNNIVWIGDESHNFAPFVDTNPRAGTLARYKALGGTGKGLIAFRSPDGIRWRRMRSEPVITEGQFDSLNTVFWDGVRHKYLEYHRGWVGGWSGVRSVMTCESEDFVHWSKPRFVDWGDAPVEHMYTNAIRPYFRNPRLLIGFPMRFVPDRAKLPEDPYPALSDAVLMVSRDGYRFKRWLEAWQRPGPQRERWVNRNNLPAWGLLVTRSSLSGSPDEISFYSTEGYYLAGQVARLRRFTLRLDGFVSVNAPYSGGEVLTCPMVLQGGHLQVNYATSAVGNVQVEITDPQGNVIRGLSAEDCTVLYGDEVEANVTWKKADLRRLKGQTVRLRFLLRDADLYAFRCV